MRTKLFSAAALIVLVSSTFAAASPVGISNASTPTDYYSFAGGQDASVSMPLEAGRSAAIDGIAPRAFTGGDLQHAFAPWGYAD